MTTPPEDGAENPSHHLGKTLENAQNTLLKGMGAHTIGAPGPGPNWVKIEKRSTGGRWAEILNFSEFPAKTHTGATFQAAKTKF